MIKENWKFFYYLEPIDKPSKELSPVSVMSLKVNEKITVRQFIEDLMAFKLGRGYIKVKDPTSDSEGLWYIEYDGDCLGEFPDSFYNVLDRQIEKVLWAASDNTSTNGWGIILKA